MRQKGFVPVVLLVFAVLAVLVFVIFRTSNLGKSLTTSATPSPVPISGWRTYVEDSGKYKFKYPPNLDFDNNGGYIWVGAAVGGFDLENKTNKYEYIDFGILNTKLPDFKNYYLNKNTHKSTRNSYTTTEFEGFDQLKNIPIYTIVFSSDNLIYTFTSPKQMIEILEQVASTFTFLH